MNQTHPTPAQIVDKLGKFVIGQKKAKVAVSIALRSRWRRLQVEEPLRHEISPKNILMVGPTGVGKTEIARRLADQSDSPFIKVEATKFTEVGYVGRDVDSIIRDLIEVAMQMARDEAEQQVMEKAEEMAIERILDVLNHSEPEENKDQSEARKIYKEKIIAGELDEKMIEIDLHIPEFGVEIMAPAGMEEMSQQLQSMFNKMKTEKSQKKKLTVADALRYLTEEEASKLINEDDIRQNAIDNAEQKGIVFIDEIDKVVKSHNQHGADVSREGVQRDLLPMLEGTTVSTKYGHINTDHILFIASGAFMSVSPKDMISELQGRLPIRVNLESLSQNDFQQILTEPSNSLTKQYTALMQTENISLNFTSDGVEKIAHIAWKMNTESDNIGARRLHTVLEKLLETISYDIDQFAGEAISIDAKFVQKHLSGDVPSEDSDKWLL